MRPSVTNDVGRALYVVRTDRRAWRLARYGGTVDQDARRIWQRLVADLEPDLVVDIGANYGEILLGVRAYPAGAALHAVEANPSIADRLRRSLDASDLEVRLHRVAASSSAGQVDLHLDARSSGTSSIEIAPAGNADIARRGWTSSVRVPAVRLDEIIGPTSGTLLFKVDVEGHEAQVIEGMTGLLEAATRWCGLIEWMPGTVLRSLGGGAHAYAARADSAELVPVDLERGASLWGGADGWVKDLVVASHPLT